jgi:hypothetical protein
MESDEQQKYDFVAWLKHGESEPRTGGFLIPQFLDIPLPGFKASFYRWVGRLYMRFGIYGSGYILFMKGNRQVDTLEYLRGKAR